MINFAEYTIVFKEEMRVIKNKLIPPGKNFLAINLFGVVFAKDECSQRVLDHEAIHTAQMRELLYVPFYLLYVIEWMVRLVIMRDSFAAYRSISFEREAYANEGAGAGYLVNRRPFAFLRHLRKD